MIPGLGRSTREGKGYPFQYSGLENSMDYTVAKSQTELSDFHFHFLYSPTLTSKHNKWKNTSFEYMNLCRQSDVSYFKYTV